MAYGKDTALGPGPWPDCNARYRLGAALVPLGPSITMRGTALAPLRYRSGPLFTMRGTASVPLRYRSGPLLQPRLRFTEF